MQSISDSAAFEYACWVALNRKRQTLSTQKLVEYYHNSGTLRTLLDSPDEFAKTLRLSERENRSIQKYLDTLNLQEMASWIQSLARKDVTLLRIVDDKYPHLLRETMELSLDPPIILFHKGSLRDLNNCIAIVGTRAATPNGLLNAFEFARSLAQKGYTIASGLARGIDTFAHCGALAAKGGQTVAILPWMDPVYPPESVRIASIIEKRGAIISEQYHKEFEKPAPGKFVERNKITSGISKCTIAVESAEEGGTVHQVYFASGQRRPIFTIEPDYDFEDLWRGYFLFLSKGAVSVNSPEEVLRHIESYPKQFAPGS